MWRAGKGYGVQIVAAGRSRRKTDRGNGGACLSRNRRSASRAAPGHFDYSIYRNGNRVQAAGSRGPGAVCPRTQDVPAHGRSAYFKRRRGPTAHLAAGNARSGSGRALIRGYEEWIDGSGGGGVLSSGAGHGLFVCAQAGYAAGVEDAFFVSADGGVADQ